jgi:hypothetical protein
MFLIAGDTTSDGPHAGSKSKMQKVSLAGVLAFLTNATPDERAKVRAALDALAQFGGSPVERKLARQDDVLLDIIVDYMTRKGCDLSLPTVLMAGKHYGTFKKKCVPVYEFVKPVGGRNEQRALLRIGIAELYADLTRMNLAVTSRLMMAHIHRLPAVLNRAFPGYAKIGALKLILVKRKHNGKKYHH